MEDNFFEETKEQSKIKISIVSEYFKVWSGIIGNATKRDKTPLVYIDLFSGQGIYDDEVKSVPILVLESVIENPIIRDRFKSLFNDNNEKYINHLKRCVEEVPKIALIKHPPKITTQTVDITISDKFKNLNKNPIFLYVDPFGVIGPTLDLFKTVLNHWGSDCVFFFNYNRINGYIDNPCMIENVDSIFGKDTAQRLRRDCRFLSPAKREHIIMHEYMKTLAGIRGNFFQSFRFRDKTGKKISHYLIFISKHHRGYIEMKKIMARHSSQFSSESIIDDQPKVPSFEYNPKSINERQLTIFDVNPLYDLYSQLRLKYKNKSIKLEDIFIQTSVGSKFLFEHYAEVLKWMEKKGEIEVIRKEKQRRNSQAFKWDSYIFFK